MMNHPSDLSQGYYLRKTGIKNIGYSIQPIKCQLIECKLPLLFSIKAIARWHQLHKVEGLK